MSPAATGAGADRNFDALQIAIAPDDNYAAHGAAMLHSFFAHHARQPVVVHVVHDVSLSQNARAQLRNFIESQGGTMREHCVPQTVVDRLPESKRYPKSAWFRIFFADVIDVPRVLYLDCDLIITGDLIELWKADLKGKLAAAVADARFPGSDYYRYVLDLGIALHDDYLNSGVMVMDLDAMRSAGCGAALFELVLSQRVPMPCADQDALNVVLRGRWVRLHSKWNVMPPVYLCDDALSSVPTPELREARRDTRVIHFFGVFKPWLEPCAHPFKDEYRALRRAIPWPLAGIPAPSLTYRILRFLPINRRLLLLHGWNVRRNQFKLKRQRWAFSIRLFLHRWIFRMPRFLGRPLYIVGKLILRESPKKPP